MAILAILRAVGAFGLVGMLVMVVVVAILVTLIVTMATARTRRQMTAIETAGAILATPCNVELTADGDLPDLNHRTGTELGSGTIPLGFEVSGIATADRSALTLATTKNKVAPPRTIQVPWTAVRSAEILPRSRSVTLVLHLVDGERHRMDLSAPPARVAALLEAVGVPPPAPDQAIDPRLVVGATVDGPGLPTGTVVAVMPRTDEPGHAEVFVRSPTGATESWDSSELRVIT